MNKYISLIILCLIISSICIVYGFVIHNINYTLIGGLSTSIGFIILYIYLGRLEKKGVKYVIEF
jgi:Na+-transporting NADH:ubiquinone oxidoreductase subunit NqrD